MAAVIGREFSYDLLLPHFTFDRPELDSTLAHLSRAKSSSCPRQDPSPRYAFKHALRARRAYESLFKSSRAGHPWKVASALEKEWPETIAGQPELLAYHYSMARDPEFAARTGSRAVGARAAGRPISKPSCNSRTRSNSWSPCRNSPERMAKELEVQLSLGLCFIAVRGYSSDDTRKSFERARSLSAEIGEPQKEIQATFGLWGHYWMRARHDQAIEHGETLLARAEQLRDPMSLSRRTPRDREHAVHRRRVRARARASRTRRCAAGSAQPPRTRPCPTRSIRASPLS